MSFASPSGSPRQVRHAIPTELRHSEVESTRSRIAGFDDAGIRQPEIAGGRTPMAFISLGGGLVEAKTTVPPPCSIGGAHSWHAKVLRA